MPGRLARLLLILTPALGIAGYIAWSLTRGTTGDSSSSASAGGRLVVVAVFDQMRGDYPIRWAEALGDNGLKAMARDGVWYANVTLPYACSATGPGHASIGTGAPPSAHGVIDNRWYDRGRDRLIDSWTTDDRRYQRVPPGNDGWAALAPTRLLVPGVGDAVRTSGGRCFSLSLKGRSAVLMGGKNPDGVYAFDTALGEFHTSSYYREAVHTWAEAFNSSGARDRWAGKSWDRLGDAAAYDRLAGKDDQAGESGTGVPPTRTFPHLLPPAGRPYYDELERTPFGNDMLWAFAKACVEGEDLGRRDRPDLLYVGFSATDVVGHAHGPDSHEVLDATLRADALVAEMIAYLDRRLGRERYTLIVTADHGVCPLPEVSAKTHPTAKRIHVGDLVAGLDEALDKAFGAPADGVPGRWVDGNPRDTHPWVFLNPGTIQASGAPSDVVRNYARSWLANRGDAADAFTRTQLEKGTFEANSVGRAVQLAYHPERCGDLYVLTNPYVLVMGGFSTGTDHGTPHEYDRHVPLFAVGAGVPKLGQRDDAVSSLSVTTLTANALGVPPPADAKEPVPAGLGG